MQVMKKTEQVDHVFGMAEQEARQRSAGSVELEHVWLALLQEQDAPGVRELAAFGVDPSLLAAAIEAGLGQTHCTPQSGEIDFSADVRDLLKRIALEAYLLGDNDIGTEHLLLGLLKFHNNGIDQAIQSLGLNCDSLVDQINIRLRRRAKRASMVKPTSVGLSSAVREILALAPLEAAQAGRTAVEPEHLLMAILKRPSSAAAAALVEKGVTLEWLRERFRA